jgi:hypothetical protein
MRMVQQKPGDPLLQGLRQVDLRFPALCREGRCQRRIRVCEKLAGDSEASAEMKTPGVETPGD